MNSPARTRSSLLPALVGAVVLAGFVALLGNETVADEVFDSGELWLRDVVGPIRWEFAPDGSHVGTWIAGNLPALLFVPLGFASLAMATGQRARWSFATTFMSAWGAVVAAGALTGVLTAGYIEVVEPYGPFGITPPGLDVVDRVHVVTRAMVSTSASVGLWVAVVVAAVAAAMGPGADRSSSGGGPDVPPTVVQPASALPPLPPPPPSPGATPTRPGG